MGVYCNQGGKAEPLYQCLTANLGQRKPPWDRSSPVNWEIANCLSMCGAGPNMVIYPEDRTYNHLDLATLSGVVHDVLEEIEEK